MDDGDLGNFFAKKDKIKKKKKGTKVTSATLIEQLKSDTNINEEQQSQQQSLSEAKVARPDDSEWVEINDGALTEGLSDLKIKSLDAKEEEEELARQQQEALRLQEQAALSDEERGKEGKGPWSQLSGSPPRTYTSNPTPVSNVPQIPSNLVSSGGKYVPPGQRSSAAGPAPVRRGREQINVNSVDQFPDLYAGKSDQKSKEKHDPSFDTAKGGGRKGQQTQAKAEQVQLNNKFQVLEC